MQITDEQIMRIAEDYSNEFGLESKHTKEFARAVVLAAAAPIDMILYCPNCGEQHVDAPNLCSVHDCHIYGVCYAEQNKAPEQCDQWTNPPHRSHLCHKCGTVWRPADVATNGVASIKTTGKADTWVAHPQEVTAMGARDLAIEALESAQNGLIWYQNHNTDAVNGSDDEMNELIERALAALKGPQKPELNLQLGEPVLQTERYKGPHFDPLTGERLYD